MFYKVYDLHVSPSFTSFEFISCGPKGKITKVVQYSPTAHPEVYNLGFGDKNGIQNNVDDSVVTNNGDGRIVLATVAKTVFLFTSINPNAWIYIVGNTKGRTRLYRIGIILNIKEIRMNYKIYGLKDESWKSFRKGVNYEAFLVRRKNSNFVYGNPKNSKNKVQ